MGILPRRVVIGVSRRASDWAWIPILIVVGLAGWKIAKFLWAAVSH
jgi:hypothetical protein